MKVRTHERIFDLLFEQDTSPKEAPEAPVSVRQPELRARPAADSIDDQVDALILRYENASIKEGTTLAESLQGMSLKYLLEQDELGLDDPAAGGEDPAGGEAGAEAGPDAPDPEGSEAMGVTEPAEEQKIPPLDIDAFTNRVARLTMNYKNLLRIEDAIVNRAKNFLDENYGDKFVTKFLQVMDEQYGLRTDESGVEYPPDDETFGLGANPAGAGSVGGA